MFSILDKYLANLSSALPFWKRRRTETLIFDSVYLFGKKHQDSDFNLPWEMRSLLVCRPRLPHHYWMRAGLYSRDHRGTGVVIPGYLLSHLLLQLVQPGSQNGAYVLWGRPLSSSSCIAAEERVEHGLLHALLVLPAPCNHCPVTVGSVQMVAIARKGQAYDRLIWFGKCNFSHRLQVPCTP